MGTYIHGLFVDDQQRSGWFSGLGGGSSPLAYSALIDETLDRLAVHIAAHVDLGRLFTLSR